MGWSPNMRGWSRLLSREFMVDGSCGTSGRWVCKFGLFKTESREMAPGVIFTTVQQDLKTCSDGSGEETGKCSD